MRKILSVALLMMAVVLTGCNQEKAQVESYLKAIETSRTEMQSKGKEMQASMQKMQEEMTKGGPFDEKKVKDQLTAFIETVKAEEARVKGLSVPDKCKALHEAVVKDYTTTVALIEKMPSMVGVTKKASEMALKLKADPKKQKEVMLEMRGVQEEMFKFQQEMAPLAKEIQTQEKIIESEQKKLRSEFQLPPLATATPAADAAAQPAATATPVAVPAKP